MVSLFVQCILKQTTHGALLCFPLFYDQNNAFISKTYKAIVKLL
ncbi:hypothetical protein BCBMB205_13440 [Bacillus sp. CN2]|nr:hypothetical protein BCBMB205_13440 [Bacillus velezensis]ARZ57677.1 hypothetical protein BAGQ_1443 [Bacillus velezensis]GFR53862.1 hypothetical protein BCBMB205_13440 [Bacillus sp. CN2]